MWLSKIRISLIFGMAIVGLTNIVPADIRSTLFSADITRLAGTVGFSTCWPERIVLHHTALSGIPDAAVDAALIDRIHQGRGFSVFFAAKTYHIGYHYVIRANGSLDVGRPERCEGAHVGGRQLNRTSLGIVVVGDFTAANSHPTPTQVRTCVTLLRTLCIRYNLRAVNVVPHSSVRGDTVCPGRGLDVDHIRRELTSAPTEQAALENP